MSGQVWLRTQAAVEIFPVLFMDYSNLHATKLKHFRAGEKPTLPNYSPTTVETGKRHLLNQISVARSTQRRQGSCHLKSPSSTDPTWLCCQMRWNSGKQYLILLFPSICIYPMIRHSRVQPLTAHKALENFPHHLLLPQPCKEVLVNSAILTLQMKKLRTHR